MKIEWDQVNFLMAQLSAYTAKYKTMNFYPKSNKNYISSKSEGIAQQELLIIIFILICNLIFGWARLALLSAMRDSCVIDRAAKRWNSDASRCFSDASATPAIDDLAVASAARSSASWSRRLLFLLAWRSDLHGLRMYPTTYLHCSRSVPPHQALSGVIFDRFQ